MKLSDIFGSVKVLDPVTDGDLRKALKEHGFQFPFMHLFYDDENNPIIVKAEKPTIIIFDSWEYNHRYIEDIFIKMCDGEEEKQKKFRETLKKFDLILSYSPESRLITFGQKRIQDYFEKPFDIDSEVYPGIIGLCPKSGDVLMCRENIAPVSPYDIVNMVGYIDSKSFGE